MTAQPEAPISQELLQQAADNYYHCLNLPRGSNVIVVSESIPEGGRNVDASVLLRNTLADQIRQKAERDDHSVAHLSFNNETTEDEFRDSTSRTLSEYCLEDGDKPPASTTIVYLGDYWANRGGLYQAANEHGLRHDIRIAGSIGLTSGDIRVLSALTREKQREMSQVSNVLEAKFQRNPKGFIQVKTLAAEGHEHLLNLPYDCHQAPFKTDPGRIDDEHPIKMGAFRFHNIPGGHFFGAPYEFKHTNGKFVAQGIVFNVVDGLIADITDDIEGSYEKLDPDQRRALDYVKGGGGLPLSELGIGLHRQVNVPSFSDCSMLTRTKSGVYFGLGEAHSDTSEAEQIRGLPSGRVHYNFILSDPELSLLTPSLDDPIPIYQHQATAD